MHALMKPNVLPAICAALAILALLLAFRAEPVRGQSDGDDLIVWQLNHSFSLNTSSAVVISLAQPGSSIFPFFPEVQIISNSSAAVSRSAFVFPCFSQAYVSPSHTIFCLCLTGVAPYRLPFFNGTPSFMDGYPSIIWRANRLTPALGGTVSLTLQEDGDLVLRGFSDNGIGTVAWRSNTSGLGVTRMELSQQPANLILYDESNITIWQSSVFPSDTLTYRQRLKEGLKLVSYASLTEDNSSYSEYSLEINQTAGLMTLFFKKRASSPAIPYWSFNGTSLIDTPPGGGCGPDIVYCNSNVFVDKDAFFVSITDGGLTVGNPWVASIPGLGYPIAERDLPSTILRLDTDGNLRLLSIRQTWIGLADLFSPEDACLLPLSCGTYGICEGAGKQCKCPHAEGQFNSSIVPLDVYDLSRGCKLSSPLPTCENTTMLAETQDMSAVANPKLRMERVDRVGYFAAQSYVRILSNLAYEDVCSALCLLNCTCLAAFWNLTVNSCSHIAEEQLGSFRGGGNWSDGQLFVKLNVLPSPPGAPGLPVAPSPPVGRKNTEKVTVGIIISTVGLLVASIFLSILWYIRRKAQGFVSIDGEVTGHAGMLKLPRRYSYNELCVVTKGFSHKLGKGGFGSVYAGISSDGTTKVAVKKLEGMKQGEKEFQTELAIMGGIHHYNLLSLMGYCAEGADRRLLVYKYMENGSLDQWLFTSSLPRQRKEGATTLKWGVRYEIAVGVAKGLAYLHEECNMRIIHLDIKPQNILLDEGFVAKVADFGLSRGMEREESHVVTTMRGTPGYLAPEWLRHGTIDVKCDVFSFGMLLMEIVSGRKNVDRNNVEAPYYIQWAYSRLVSDKCLGRIDLSDKSSSVLNDGRSGIETVERMHNPLYDACACETDCLTDAQLESDYERAQVLRVIMTAFLCVLERPEWRPSMSKVVQMLEGQVPLSDVDLSSLHQGLIFVLGSYYSCSSDSHGYDGHASMLRREFNEQLDAIFALSSGTSFPTLSIEAYSQVSGR